MHKLQERIEKANAQKRLALIPFITAGYPKKENFLGLLKELDQNGADIIEIGVPFSDPVADGPVVEAASVLALENGVTLNWILQTLIENTYSFKAGLVLMGYYNPFLQYGLEKLAIDAKKAGIEGFIIPDLPFEEAENLRDILKKAGIALIALVGTNTSEDRMRMYAKNSEGYVYVVSVLGTTGERKTFNTKVEETLARAKKVFYEEQNIPITLGFGISKPEQIKELKNIPHGIIFGSALLKDIEKTGSTINFMKNWQ
ncbi:tryptophan synthase subunit alpha [Desulfovibrio litoralis]|uniref:Tryptophan synthase alpha chain n=1 Tax=Desulfovibrio litoralis DSM 11393 TaxID=1121455 RepID=A0A1M7SES2_9BACT|nr:tryptophan synthase subunit alpha [Desulfovibrio litoralis]SHN56934.1 tryptophan synthase, alpha chain [Desulfovibrio litoralis DSM 11393]